MQSPSRNIPAKGTKAAAGAKVTKGTKKDSVNNSVDLDVKNPIPFGYSLFSFDYITGSRYIPFLSPDDTFAKTLLEAKLLSSTHAACVETKRDYCAGQGMADVERKDFTPEIEKYLRCVNLRNESAHTVNKKVFGSHFTFGNTPIEIVRLTVGTIRKVYIYVHNFMEWRLAWPDANGIVKEAIQSRLFLRVGIISDSSIALARKLPIYDFSKPDDKSNWFQDKGGVERTMIWLKNDMDGYEHYGMPQAVSSLIYQVLEYKSARFNLDNFDNNMVLGGILALAGNLSQAEADKIGKTIIKSHTGDGKRGRVAVLSSEEGITGSEFHEYNTKKEGSFDVMDDKVMNKIIMANQWHAMLAGLDHGAALGRGNGFLKKIYDLKKKTVIDPMQQMLIENLWVPLQYIIQNHTGLPMLNYELEIIDIDPVSALGDVDPTPVIKIDELREAAGLSPLEDTVLGQKLVGELKVTAAPAAQPAQGDGGHV